MEIEFYLNIFSASDMSVWIIANVYVQTDR